MQHLFSRNLVDTDWVPFHDFPMRLATYCIVLAVFCACGDDQPEVGLTVLSARATGEGARVDIRLENRSPSALPAGYSLFRLEVDGLETPAIDGTCPPNTMVSVGATLDCQLTFDLADGSIPSAVVYPAVDGDLVAPIPSFQQWDVATLTRGFTPTPITFSGTTGGMTDVNAFGEGCLGFATRNPNVVFTATTAFPHLRIVAKSTTDISLVVQMADGTYLCNDDFEDLLPMVEGMFPMGEYKVWVASYELDRGVSFTIGLTESPDLLPSAL